ncbi:MAG: hypothetical protein A2428_16395 [Bdellovibrionales bacterium RIFOXYC1_FULL_54_43]|nr:MAG: hypothetical protein A2428_16395 [Bdellovibrionales bacterium RIFOXYC1_FULL_54_43]OFZ83953.1 MAG: hypothetical protein A2603_10400 [Bdellovibrionales bacterium RIFOXYD1_FULL_55_31]
MQAEVELGVIIVSYNVEPYLRRCLESLIRRLGQTWSASYKIVVVDNSSRDQSVAAARELLGEHGVVLSTGQNLGYGRAINLGARSIAAQRYLIVNPDTEVTNDIIQVLNTHALENPGVGVVGCKMLDSDGSVQGNLDSLPGLFYAISHLTHAKSLLRIPLFRAMLTRMTFIPPVREYLNAAPQAEKVREVQSVPGSFFLIDGDLFRKLGGFDERIFLYYEDSDLFFRMLHQTSSRIHLLPVRGVVHHHGKSFSAVFTDMSPYKQWSLIYYFRKNHSFAVYGIVRSVLFITTLIKAVSALGASGGPRKQYLKDCLQVMKISLLGPGSFDPFNHLKAT